MSRFLELLVLTLLEVAVADRLFTAAAEETSFVVLVDEVTATTTAGELVAQTNRMSYLP